MAISRIVSTFLPKIIFLLQIYILRGGFYYSTISETRHSIAQFDLSLYDYFWYYAHRIFPATGIWGKSFCQCHSFAVACCFPVGDHRKLAAEFRQFTLPWYELNVYMHTHVRPILTNMHTN